MVQVPPKRELDQRSADAWGVAERLIASTIERYGPPPVEVSRKLFNRLKQAFVDATLPAGEMHGEAPGENKVEGAEQSPDEQKDTTESFIAPQGKRLTLG